jgi:hypothetical protein
MSGRQKPKASDFGTVCEGEFAAVRLAPAALREFEEIVAGTDALSTKRRVHLQRSFSEFCGNGDPARRLSDEKFKKEGNFPGGDGSDVAIWAFKVWKWRLYGALLVVDGKKCFVGVRVDANKKQQKANKNLLKAAAKDVAALHEH